MRKILVDSGSSADIIFLNSLKQMNIGDLVITTSGTPLF